MRDLRWCTPDDDDFKLISEAYVDCQLNGDQAALEHRPEKLVHDAEYVYGDLGTALKWMIVAALLGWRELFEMLKEICPNVGWGTGEIDKTMKELRAQSSSTLAALYSKHCKPALATVAAKPATQPTTVQPATKPTKPAPAASASAGSLPQNLKILAQPNTTFCRLVVYDPRYQPPARRHLYLTKKSNGIYRVSLGGATVTSWYNEPFFESIQQAKDFLTKISGVNTRNNMMDYQFCITDKPVASGTTNIISDLANCVLVDSACGPVYIHKNNNYCVESLNEDLVETIEKHEDLNPAIFTTDAKLKPEVKDKINEIVDEFVKEFIEVEIDLDIEDIILTGSNASYNYTADSDLDIHILADTSKIADTLNLYKVIYNAYKSAFNKNYEIELNGVPVEVYVETQDTPLVSNGIYSVVNDEWVKEPTKEDIPEVDQEAIDKAFKPWEKRYKALLSKITDDTKDESEIDKFIDSLYELRQEGLSTDGEYSIGNLVFKEMRNLGYLDELKELRHEVIAHRLSLYEDFRRLTEKERRDYYNKISQLTHYQPLIQANGLFEIYNVKEVDLHVVLSNLRRQPEVEYVHQSAEKLDFSKINYHGIPSKLYKITGKITLN